MPLHRSGSPPSHDFYKPNTQYNLHIPNSTYLLFQRRTVHEVDAPLQADAANPWPDRGLHSAGHYRNESVRICEREDEMEKFQADRSPIRRYRRQCRKSPVSVHPRSGGTLSFGVTLIYIYGANLIASPAAILTIGDLILFTRYMRKLTNPLKNLSQLIGQ